MFFFSFLACFFFVSASASLAQGQGGFDIPIQRRVGNRSYKRGDVSGSTGLGNNADVLYTVPIELGNSVAAVNLDTGSSDLWVVSDACQADACKGSTVARYPMASAKSTQTNISLQYGDSTTGTSASGVVGLDTATIAGIAMTNQAVGLINITNNQIVQFEAAGIFGLGFPTLVEEARVVDKFGPIQETDDFLRATYTDGPLLTRIAMTNQLEMAMFSITLQRSTVDISGNGMLTIGRLPDGVDNSSLTWVPVRLYRVEDGGLQPPTFAPNEYSPLNRRWEIDIDGVFLDGQKVADSTIPPVNVDPRRVTALIDTGNSIVRGPQDMVANILKAVSPTYDPTNRDAAVTLPCSVPHTLAFQIGGKIFPVDPRDFISPSADGDTTTCVADNIVATDAPRTGSVYRWSLGDTFMKSNLIAFHYGNLTHPSVDPPRIGFLSTVPTNADDLLRQAVQDAKDNGGDFEETLVMAPTASAAAAGAQVTVTPARAAMLTRTVTLSPPAMTSSSKGNLDRDNAAIAFALPTYLGRCIPLALLLMVFVI
ncbi:aspartic peptidase domain-containing protein [Lyophyllum atratum]|nr:aspartic peptidase domain-containing protein [Lyophyllum atratum]